MEISWNHRLRNVELLYSQGGEDILRIIKRREANWIGQLLRSNCLVKHVIEGQIEGEIEVTG
jgi:hypothetical protein